MVSKVVPNDKLIPEAVQLAAKIASMSKPVIRSVKECVNRAFESSLTEGLLYERRAFHATWGLEDRREGMTAFAEKRKPTWKHC